jgi:hypothetical protein
LDYERRLAWKADMPSREFWVRSRCRCADTIGEIKRWDEVMMHIDKAALFHDGCLSKNRHERSRSRESERAKSSRTDRGYETSPADGFGTCAVAVKSPLLGFAAHAAFS